MRKLSEILADRAVMRCVPNAAGVQTADVELALLQSVYSAEQDLSAQIE